MTNNLRSEAEKLASRPYTIEVVRDETTDGEPGFVAYVLELDGCMGQGLTSEEAVDDVIAAMIDYIESLLEDGEVVPEPRKQPAVTLSTGASTTLVNNFKVEQRSHDDSENENHRHVQRFNIVPA